MKNKFLVSASLIVVSIFVFIFAAAFIYLRKLDEQTCQFIIEQTLVYAVNQKAFKLETSLNSNWKELVSVQRQRLVDFARENVSQNDECGSYPYLIKGTDAAGNELPLFARKGDSGFIEFRLGK